MTEYDKPQRCTPADLNIRWMIRRDNAEVMAIEKASFDVPWTAEDFGACLRQRNCIGMVAEIDEGIVGYMIYQVEPRHIQLLNFAVHPDFRRHGVGTAMIDKLKAKLRQQNRRKIAFEIRETNLPMQFFLRANGFMATAVVWGLYHDIGEDGYLMEFVL